MSGEEVCGICSGGHDERDLIYHDGFPGFYRYCSDLWERRRDFSGALMDGPLTSKIPPALSADHWEAPRIALGDEWFAHNPDRVWLPRELVRLPAPLIVNDRQAHGIAAMCLYGKPFGFTRDDYEWIRWVRDKNLSSTTSLDHADHILALIAALLPPKERA